MVGSPQLVVPASIETMSPHQLLLLGREPALEEPFEGGLSGRPEEEGVAEHEVSGGEVGANGLHHVPRELPKGEPHEPGRLDHEIAEAQPELPPHQGLSLPVAVDRVAMPRRTYKRRDPINLVYASAEAREYAIEKAEQLQSTLEPHYPILVKFICSFDLGLPVHFCMTSLPKNDGFMTLVDGDGKELPMIYLARKTGLSGGWKGFSVAHERADGDAGVFQLIKPTTMKVYIVRANGFDKSEEP
ncbi:Epimerase domain-containing protein [Psidium guajava]|nr:Epimerase domain-containing protein [Psidium guajava]